MKLQHLAMRVIPPRQPSSAACSAGPARLAAVTEISLAADLPKSPREAILIGLMTDDGSPALLESELIPEKVGDKLLELALAVGATGKAGSVVRAPGDLLGYRVIVFTGIGEKFSLEALRRSAGTAARELTKLTTLDVLLPTNSTEAIGAVAEGLGMGAYRFDRHRKQPPAIERAVIVTGFATTKEAETELRRAAAVSAAVNATRELVNTPPNELYPGSFADLAKEAGRAVGLTVTVMDEQELAAGGFGGILAVGGGSTRPPRLVKLEYKPRKSSRHVALVGKGITFDSGGLSLKPPEAMETMKSDMAGAAAVLNTVVAAAKLELPVRITGWLAIAENMPSGTATRPSDVITIRGGKTVEVLNTDAEGRLVLADALVAAAEENPDAILDIATLTGAQLIALGKRYGAVMGEEFTRSDVVAAADAAGEDFWPMPLPEDLFETLLTPYADLKNKGTREGGMLIGGLFLEHFVRDLAWAHLDIAGPAWADKAWGYNHTGGTGAGVRTMLGYLENIED